MRTFAELLREYTGRTGISDAELARAVGVQRQTIFRWKEGVVARPRSADEVLRLAAKLRLTPEERDTLLLAAGFPPVAAVVPTEPAVPAEPLREAPHADPAGVSPGSRTHDLDGVPSREETSTRATTRRRWLIWAAGVAVLLLLLAGGVYVAVQQEARYPRAAPGERLVVLAQFGNYTGGAQGYNVAGRLSEALNRELTAAGLKDVRLAVWPAAVTDEPDAISALKRSGAVLLIWGEYDSGRVVARFLLPEELAAEAREISLQASTPAELPAVVNSTLPGDIRYLALYSLAQIYLHEDDPRAAKAALAQGALHLPGDTRTQITHHFLWGFVNQTMEPPNLDAAIQGYTEALQLDEGLEAGHNNRGLAYLKRRGPDDMAAAVDDLTRYIAVQPDDPSGYNNRGSAYFYLGGPDDLQRALEDFDRAIELAPTDPTGYYNRGLVYVRLDDEPRWRADLQRALEAGHAGAHEALCWGYSLGGEPAMAVEHCREALKADGPGPLENLGVAYARTGAYEQAAVTLESYRSELAKAGAWPSAGKEAQLTEWVAALKAGKSPFDEAVIQQLREE